jgi:hypothetical protein
MFSRRSEQLSNRKRSNAVPAITVSVRRFRVSIRSHEPVELNDEELIDNQDLTEVFDRAMTSVARASFMVEGPNREVFWSISVWQDARWLLVMEGRSRVKDRPLKNTMPFLSPAARYPGSLK